MTALHLVVTLRRRQGTQLLRMLQTALAAASSGNAADETDPPRALEYPMHARARRLLRNARVSWW